MPSHPSTTIPNLITLTLLLLLFTLSPNASASAAADSNPAAPAEYTDSTVFQKAVLAVTNAFRNQHNASAVVWNATLEAFAVDAGKACVFEHSGGPYGENLASGYANASAAITAWAHEREDYDFQKAEFAHPTGHFTQLVWKASTSIGCSRTNCTNDDDDAPGWYVICEYFPHGNVIGAFRENVQEQMEDEGEGECMQGAVCSAASGRVRVGRGGLLLWVGIWMGIWSVLEW